MAVDLLFATPVWRIVCSGFDGVRDDLRKWIYSCMRNNPDGVTVSNRGGWQSSAVEDEVSFEPYRDFVEENVFREFGKSVSPDRRVVVSSMWVNVNPPGCGNLKHQHPLCDLAGVLWVQGGGVQCGALKIEHPGAYARANLIAGMGEVATECSFRETYQLAPTEGTMVIFPSDLAHWVETNHSGMDRLSVAFNLKLGLRASRRVVCGG